MGWTGLKLVKEEHNSHPNHYDIGYRMIQKYWGNGYATESAKVSLDYGFEELNLAEIVGTAAKENLASKNVLRKIGLKYINDFMYDDIPSEWYSMKREEWEMLRR